MAPGQPTRSARLRPLHRRALMAARTLGRRGNPDAAGRPRWVRLGLMHRIGGGVSGPAGMHTRTGSARDGTTPAQGRERRTLSLAVQISARLVLHSRAGYRTASPAIAAKTRPASPVSVLPPRLRPAPPPVRAMMRLQPSAPPTVRPNDMSRPPKGSEATRALPAAPRHLQLQQDRPVSPGMPIIRHRRPPRPRGLAALARSLREQTRVRTGEGQSADATARHGANGTASSAQPAPAPPLTPVPVPVPVLRHRPGPARTGLAAISVPAVQRLMRGTTARAAIGQRPLILALRAASNARPVAPARHPLEAGLAIHPAAPVAEHKRHIPADRVLRRTATGGPYPGRHPATPAVALAAGDRTRAQTTPAPPAAPAAQTAGSQPPATLDPAAVRRAFEQIPAPELSRIADRLMSQIERRGRIERERHGWD